LCKLKEPMQELNINALPINNVAKDFKPNFFITSKK